MYRSILSQLPPPPKKIRQVEADHYITSGRSHWTCFSLQHFIFSVSTLIDMLVPDIPGGLDEAIKREAYQAKQIMSDHHGLMGGSSSSEDFLMQIET